MDVVRKAIEQLKGKVEIFSVEGKECRFVICLPLILAIMDGIIVQIGEEGYIPPIREILRPGPGDLTTVQHKGGIDQGPEYPITSRSSLFSPRDYPPPKKIPGNS